MPNEVVFHIADRYLLLGDGCEVTSVRVGGGGAGFGEAAAVATIFDLLPDAFPFFAPCEWASAVVARFLRQVLFFHIFHDSGAGRWRRLSR